MRPDALEPLPVVIGVDVLFEARVRPDAWRVRNSTFLQNPGLKPSGLAIPCVLHRLRMGPIHKFMYGRRRRGLVIIIFMIMSRPRRWSKAPQCIRKQAIPYDKMALFFSTLAWSLRTLSILAYRGVPRNKMQQLANLGTSSVLGGSLRLTVVSRDKIR